MKIFYGVLFFAIVLGLGYITWLNKDSVFYLKLSPEINGYYYHTLSYPIGLWISASLVIGFMVGYVLGILKK